MKKREIVERNDGTYGVTEDGKERDDVSLVTRIEAGQKIRDLDDAERAGEAATAASKQAERDAEPEVKPEKRTR